MTMVGVSLTHSAEDSAASASSRLNATVPRQKFGAGPPGRERADPEGDGAGPRAARPGALEDRVLRPEAGKAEAAAGVDAGPGNRQRADHHHPEGDRDLLTESAVVTHVLLMVHRVD